MTKTTARMTVAATRSGELIQSKNENTLAALLRAHTSGVPLVIIFNIEERDHYIESMSTVQGVFHCSRCANFWKDTQKVLTICYKQTSYIQDPIVPLTVSDATALTNAALQWSKIFATDDLVTVFPLLKKALCEEERIEILHSHVENNLSNDTRSRFLVFVGGEKGPNGRVFPFGSVDENGDFHKGGPPVAARRLHRFDKLLYRKRAEEGFFRKFGLSLSFQETDCTETEFSLELVEPPIDISPSASCCGDDGGFVVDIPCTGLESNVGAGESEENRWASKDQEEENVEEKTNSVNFKINVPHVEIPFEVTEDEMLKGKKVLQKDTEDKEVQVRDKTLPGKVFENIRRRYSTKTDERPASPTIATIRSGETVTRKGSFNIANSHRSQQNAVNQCVWNKTGRPRSLKPSPLIENGRLRPTIIIKSRGEEANVKTKSTYCNLSRGEEVNAKTKPTNASLTLNEPERSKSAQPNQRKDEKDRKFQDLIERKCNSKQLLQERMRQYELQQLQRLQENMQLKNPLPTLASSATFSSAVTSERTCSYINSYHSDLPDILDDWKMAMALGLSDTPLPTNAKTDKKSDFLQETQQTDMSNEWYEKLVREYAALSAISEEKSRPKRLKSPGIQVENRAKYQLRLIEEQQRQKQNRLISSNIINNEDVTVTFKKKTGGILNGISGIKVVGKDDNFDIDNIDITSKSSTILQHDTTILQHFEKQHFDRKRVKSNISMRESVKVSNDSVPADTVVETKMEATPLKAHHFVPAIEQQEYIRKSSLYSDFQPDPRFISNLTFTENYKFSYFLIPKHVKDHNNKIKTGSLWHPLRSLAKKQTVFRKERKPSLKHSSMSIMNSTSNISVVPSKKNGGIVLEPVI